jgi:hypothetical protein
MGAGKGFVADYIAAHLLGCQVDKLVTYPYLLKLQCDRDSVGIEQIREVQQFLSLSVPGTSPVRRVLILENIESLGREAQNALLKTLEETPADSVIISTIARRDSILPTIHSRMQQISIRPVSLSEANGYFSDDHNEKDIEKAYFMSEGYMGLMSAILNAEDEHPLVQAITKARQTLGESRYERMLGIDKLIKDKDASSALFLDGLYRLLHAGYKQGVLKGRNASELSKSLSRLYMVEQAASDLESKVSEKLVLTRLFFSL